MDYNTAKAGMIQLFPPSWGGNAQLQYANAAPVSISARKDGYQIAQLTIQGARAFDSTSSQWTTPDASAGDVHDPMSQKPFMWSGNNPLTYSDPTGYVAIVSETIDTSTGITNVNITLYVKFDGPDANPVGEQDIIGQIESHWSGTFGNYNVTTTVSTDLTGVDAKNVNTITINNANGAKFGVDQLNNHMTVGSKPGWGDAHEAGHLMGLPDMYDPMKTMPLQPHVPNPNYGQPWPGRAGDIMAVSNGSVTAYDIMSIVLSAQDSQRP
jgi:hypothetical protein